ncbi:MAG: 50S ribosomal protein L25 [Deltaproteobacteria bacterium]|nr:50S ribosomal protein L25 [Deltaproteobacteria bacterium]
MTQLTLAARTREGVGKETARRLRQASQIPAIFYGPHGDSLKLTVGVKDLEKVLKHAASENIILELEILSDGGSEKRTVILKELQVHPVNPVYYHADFYEIPMDKEVTFQIPLHLVNVPVGVTKGGILEHTVRELTVSCLPSSLVDQIEADVSGLDVGDALHLRDVSLPQGIRTGMDGGLTVAVVAAPAVKAAKGEEEGEEKEAEEPSEEKSE